MSIDQVLQDIRNRHGLSSLMRVEAMMSPTKRKNHPLQSGAKYIMGGISQRPWHNAEAYPELLPLLSALRVQHASIKRECSDLLQAHRAVVGRYQHYLVTNENWKAFYIFKDGILNSDAALLAPITHGIVQQYALERGLLCPFLESHFSFLLPGAKISPHCDLWNFTINLHFAVDIPDGCGIRVAGEERTWAEGECLLFDYSFLHEAWNTSSRCRACLLLDLWHPEVTGAEREALIALLSGFRQHAPSGEAVQSSNTGEVKRDGAGSV